jgi:hypothetical protein
MQRYTPRRARSVGPVSLQEALRTVGLGLEVNKVSHVELTITLSGIQLGTTSTYGVRNYTWHEIHSQSRSQQEHRRVQSRPAPWLDPAALTRWSVLLRVVGQLLDAQGVSDCVIDAAVATAGPCWTARRCASSFCACVPNTLRRANRHPSGRLAAPGGHSGGEVMSNEWRVSSPLVIHRSSRELACSFA